ncbi:cell wall-binding repeat-containing protein [Herbiconiux sp. 11R-BC]|uniref:cell wall-binding repeat-containing protein n=1 Tax=Herbiconiux sp. 11R-BC TaxID=3111637 RepID=UPI003BFC3062
MTHTRFSRALVTLVGCIALAATAAIAPGSAAVALGSRNIRVDYLDTTMIGSGLRPSMVIDPTTHRGYVLDGTKVRVLNIAGATFSPIASIDIPFPSLTTVDIDVSSHRLIVGGNNGPSIALVDVDPQSATANTVLQVLGSGAEDASLYVAIDGDFAYVTDKQKTLSRVDLRNGSWTNTAVAYGFKTIVVDSASHTAFLGTWADTTVHAYGRDGSQRSVLTAGEPQVLAVTGASLLVGAENFISRYDAQTLASTGQTQAFHIARTIAADAGAIYASNGTSRISMFDSESLALVASFPSQIEPNFIAADTSSHKILFSEGVQIEMYAASPTVSRIEGADRYEVSAAVSRGQFTAPAPVVYVASGGVFSDALSASAAAGAEGGPVLLVQKDRIPDAIATELTRLKPARIVVLGGTATIDSSVESALGNYSANVSRIGGADRFDVSAAVSHAVFGTSRPIAYIAAGATFPDALSGSAAAGKLGGPVLLTGRDALPTSVEAELRRLNPTRIVVLGGPNSISQTVIDTLTTIQSNTTRITGADRFEVSAAVSAAGFASNPKVVYVACGLVYPDALSGSAAAIANGAPVLLVTSDGIPAAVAAELSRLKPSHIVVLGGPNSVSPTVEEALHDYIG